VIEVEGWQRLTLRRLAAELGIGTTTLYHHVRDREDLLVQLLGAHLEAVPVPDLPDEPADRILIAATTMRAALRQVPWAADVLTVDGFMGRMGDDAVRLVEIIVSAAVQSGCTHEQAVALFRNLGYFTVGEVLVRVRSDDGALDRDSLLAQDMVRFEDRDPSSLPTLAAIGGDWVPLAAQDTYTVGVEAMVAAAVRAAGHPNGTGGHH
jgi:AcrR family transcriptional regulator